MKWVLVGLVLIYVGLVAGLGLLLGQERAATWSIGLFGGTLILGQLVNWLAARQGPEAAIAGDAARVLMRFVGLILLGVVLEQSGWFPERSLQLWGWLLAATLTSLVIEIAVLAQITK